MVCSAGSDGTRHHGLSAAITLPEDNCILQVPGEDTWRYLLGNTLLRMLGRLPLSLELTQPRQAASLRPFTAAAGLKPEASICEKHAVAPEHTQCEDTPGHVRATEEQAAALEMLMLMLPEYSMRQPPVLTVVLLHRWRSGEMGQLKRGLAEIEFQHAHVIALALEPDHDCQA